MRLIDCDEAIINFCFEWDDIPPTREEVIAFLKNRPDAVVRCKDCVNVQSAKINKKGFLVCQASGLEITDDDFCSYGERKEDENGRT